jgi:hypothetical protein
MWAIKPIFRVRISLFSPAMGHLQKREDWNTGILDNSDDNWNVGIMGLKHDHCSILIYFAFFFPNIPFFQGLSIVPLFHYSNVLSRQY